MIKNKNYVILLFAVGGALGLYSTFATLLEQILCPFGYTDVSWNSFISAMIERNRKRTVAVMVAKVVSFYLSELDVPLLITSLLSGAAGELRIVFLKFQASLN